MRIIYGLFILLSCSILFSQTEVDAKLLEKIDSEVLGLMDEGDIPGLSLTMIIDGKEINRNYGYSSTENGKVVDDNTLFQIGSCSKAFTALALVQLEQGGRIDFDDKVSKYLPWLKVRYKDTLVDMSIEQVMHHTSGIPWSTISKIPISMSDNALEMTVRKLINQELKYPPGKKYEYATINYDILALIIQVVENKSFESYLTQNVFGPLGLKMTTIGIPKDSSLMSEGYKIGFLKPRAYEAPIYKGNNAAGYVISNARDMGKWLKLQMGLTNHEFTSLATATHQRDESVPLHYMSAYGIGWEVSLNGTGEIFHSGYNPNFTSYIAFRPEPKIGVVALANSNSNFTEFLADKVLKIIAGDKIEREYKPDDGGDGVYSGIVLALWLYLLVVLGLIFRRLYMIKKRKISYSIITSHVYLKLGLAILFICPFLYGLFIFPRAFANFSWEAMLVWSPSSLEIMVIMILTAIGVSMVSYILAMIFPEKNEFKKKIPQILLMSILSGLANVCVVIMVTSVIGSEVKLRYLVLFYCLIMGLYLLGRRYVEVSLIKFTRNLVYDLRIKLAHKIFSTSYEKFERIDRGRIYTALNDDVNTIGHSANMIVGLTTSIITVVGAFVYISAIAFWATILTGTLIIMISILYYIVGEEANTYFEQARDSRNVFMRLVNGMIDGFKELSLHRNKKLEYKDDVIDSAGEYRDKVTTADVKFVNAFLVGESFLIIFLGTVSIGMSVAFPNVEYSTIISFVIVLLYLMGPISNILDAVPGLMNLKISWKRIQEFTEDIPANIDLDVIPPRSFKEIYKLEASGITYQFKTENGFKVGPIDLEINKGEILFLIGGNGSGKSTLAKMLTGLYSPDEGEIRINGEVVQNHELSECFSTVFSPYYLFDKLYNINIEKQQDELVKYLKVLDLDEKVSIKENFYSTIDLSGGQRKRLALLQCYLEDSPIYLFDEWAAEQDPAYRNFFYMKLLPEMKKKGKLVIAITHDDNYFSVADRIVKMNQGKLEAYNNEVFQGIF